MNEPELSPNQAAAYFRRLVAEAACDRLLAELLPLKGNRSRHFRKEALSALLLKHFPGMSYTEAERLPATKLAELLLVIRDKQQPAGLELAAIQPTPKREATLLSVRDLAVKYDVDSEALRKRLDRWRRQNFNGWRELHSSDRGPRDPRFLYEESAVLFIVKAMHAASDERPAKKIPNTKKPKNQG